MNKPFIFAIGVTIGGVAGIIASRRYFCEMYKRIAQEEIDSVKMAFKNRDKKQSEEVSKANKKEAVDMVKKLNYGSTFDEEIKKSEPFIIAPEDYGSMEEYKQKSFKHYSDGTLANEDDEPMTKYEVERNVGKDYYLHFGDFEDDSVFVRNDALKCDYEILLDDRPFVEIASNKRNLEEEE